MNTMLKMSAVAMLMAGTVQMAQAAPLTLNVTGTISPLTCDLAADVAGNTVNLGVVTPDSFGAVGTKVAAKTFHLVTSNCAWEGAATEVAVAGDMVASVDFAADEIAGKKGFWHNLGSGHQDAAIVVEGGKVAAAGGAADAAAPLTTGDRIFIAHGDATAGAETKIADLNAKSTALEAYMTATTAAQPVAQILTVPVTFTAMYQ